MSSLRGQLSSKNFNDDQEIKLLSDELLGLLKK